MTDDDEHWIVHFRRLGIHSNFDKISVRVCCIMPFILLVTYLALNYVPLEATLTENAQGELVLSFTNWVIEYRLNEGISFLLVCFCFIVFIIGLSMKLTKEKGEKEEKNATATDQSNIEGHNGTPV